MASPKLEEFIKAEQELAAFAKSLSHPARIAIIEHLLKADTCICGDIVNVLPLAQPTVSQHLKELKNAGLIKGEIEGNSVCYCIDEKNFQKLQAYFVNISTKMEIRKSNCC